MSAVRGEGRGADRRSEVAAALAQVLDADRVRAAPEELKPYECDGLSAYRATPLVAAIPTSEHEVAAILDVARTLKVPVVARGSGTGLSGGALPLADGILLSLARFNRVLAVDAVGRRSRVQPGVTNLRISQETAHLGLYYAPDPSSQIACSIGGNVAENSGGVHCLKYGLTVHNVAKVRAITIEGDVIEAGGESLDSPGYDLLALLTGSEGLLAITLEVTVKLLAKPETAQVVMASFPDVESAGEAVARVIGAGIVPAGLEMMDRLATSAVEGFVHAGYDLSAQAILLAESDGTHEEVAHEVAQIKEVMRASGATDIRCSESEAERLRFWSGRKAAFPAVGRISPDYYCIDGSIPRAALARVLGRIEELSARYGLRCANVFHAGDGNLHPLILYDANVPGELDSTERFACDILEMCVEVGGTITGEHGVGIEKINQMCTQFAAPELAQFHAVKAAFDPEGLLNPGKGVPTLHRCAEYGAMRVKGGALPHAELPPLLMQAHADAGLRERTLEALRAIRPAPRLVADVEGLKPFETDAFIQRRETPMLAVLPDTEAQVQAIVFACRALGVPVVSRGAGTGISGGAIPHRDGVLLVLSRMTRVVELDPLGRWACVEPGVRNLHVSDIAAPHGLFYAPDPSSQSVCSIGGNVAENAGGIHCLKYGLTTHNILSLRAVDADGEVIEAGGRSLDAAGYDILALLAGSEGNLGVITQAVLKLLPLPERVETLLGIFPSVRQAADAVSEIIGAGIVPAALEMMDRIVIEACERCWSLGFPPGADALLLAEVDGGAEETHAALVAVRAIMEKCGATQVRSAADAAERERLWKARKGAFTALASILPDYYTIDGTIPRRCLPAVLAKVYELAAEYGLTVGNVFHAGDGNIHPCIFYDANKPGDLAKAEDLGGRILEHCVEVGGTITGEHGVGVEKLRQMCVQFRTAELAAFHAVKAAFDPDGILNPGKAVPALKRCAEWGGMHVHGGKLPHPEIPRL